MKSGAESFSWHALCIGDSITDDVLHLQNSSGLFVGQATDLLDTITGQMPDTSSSYKWILLQPFRLEFRPINSCSLFPFVFCGNLLLLYRSCRFLLLLPTTLGITKLCNCLLYFVYNCMAFCMSV